LKFNVRRNFIAQVVQDDALDLSAGEFNFHVYSSLVDGKASVHQK
jgi:hypothetical protein